ncbi:MAG: CPBP family intramembrane glutamic endopeptidase [Sphingobacteriales bacterium]
MDATINHNFSGKRKSIIIFGVVLAVVFPFVLSYFIRFSGFVALDRIFYSRFIFWAEVLLLVVYAAKAEHLKFLLWEDKKVDAGTFVATVVVLYFGSWACSIVGLIPRAFGYHETNALMKKLAMLIAGHQLLIIFTCITAGVTEELIFRGYMIPRLALLFKNDYVAIILSAICFGALHYGYKSLHEVIFAFLIGIMFGFYYQKYRNIKVLIAAHFVIDIINMEILTHFYKMVK